MTPSASAGIEHRAARIVLDTDARPMIDRLAEAPIARIPHHDLRALATLSRDRRDAGVGAQRGIVAVAEQLRRLGEQDRKSTRLNSSHLGISYAVFGLKKKK